MEIFLGAIPVAPGRHDTQLKDIPHNDTKQTPMLTLAFFIVTPCVIWWSVVMLIVVTPC